VRCYTCGTQSLHWYYRTGVMTSSSTWPWGRLRRLHHQYLCGGVIPVFGLQGYNTDLQLFVIELLIDRSWAIWGCVDIKFCYLALNPRSGMRAWSMRSMLIWLEHIAICGHWSSRCYPPMWICLYLWDSWIEEAQDWPYAYSYARLVPQLTYGLYRINGLSAASFSNYSGYGICNGGPLMGIQRNN
jgi:hypothetical protein